MYYYDWNVTDFRKTVETGVDPRLSWGIGKTLTGCGIWLLLGKPKSGHECSIGKENDVRDNDGRSSGWGVSVNKERDQGPESSFPDPICGALSLSVGSYLVY